MTSRPVSWAVCIAALLISPVRLVAAEEGPYPDVAVVTAAMKKATHYYQSRLAVHGGYASSWDPKALVGRSESRESKTLIEIQPPGTPATGLAFLKAYRATGDKVFLEAAKGAAQALLECQLASGGWSADFDFDSEQVKKYHLRSQLEAGDTERGKRQAMTTLDDNKTQSALLFLVELRALPEAAEMPGLKQGLEFGMERLIAAQYPNGAWTQQYDGPADGAAPVIKARYPADWSRQWSKVKYTGYYTLNDGNMEKCVQLLLRAYDLTHEERYLASAKKAGDFFLLAQMPEPQPGWAQQYNRDMEPVWARKFEPPAVSGGESLGVLQALHEIWVVSGDERYLSPIKSALSWLKASALADGTHARFYELQTNKPLYFVKDSYELTYSDSNLPTHYSFKLDYVNRDVAQLEKLLERSREELVEHRKGPATEKKWASSAKGVTDKVRAALKEQNEEGVWVKKGEIDSREFIRHMNALSWYVETARKGGETFKALQQR